MRVGGHHRAGIDGALNGELSAGAPDVQALHTLPLVGELIDTAVAVRPPQDGAREQQQRKQRREVVQLALHTRENPIPPSTSQSRKTASNCDALDDTSGYSV